MANKIINIKCSLCDHVINVRQPEAPGMYKITCPQCQHQMKLQLRAQPIQLDPNQTSTEQGEKQKVCMLTDIKPWKNGTFAVRPAIPIQTPHAFHCPTCGKTVLFSLPKTGVLGVKCKICSTLTFAKGVDKDARQATNKPDSASMNTNNTDTEQESESRQPTVRSHQKKVGRGELSWGNIFRRKHYPLSEGVITIGRKDDKRPSDIEFKDAEMSRQSVELEVLNHEEKGNLFKLTVKNALNPVLLNNRPLGVGESIYLNFDDTIQLGNTVINFNELKS